MNTYSYRCWADLFQVCLPKSHFLCCFSIQHNSFKRVRLGNFSIKVRKVLQCLKMTWKVSFYNITSESMGLLFCLFEAKVWIFDKLTIWWELFGDFQPLCKWWCKVKPIPCSPWHSSMNWITFVLKHSWHFYVQFFNVPYAYFKAVKMSCTQRLLSKRLFFYMSNAQQFKVKKSEVPSSS